MRREVFNGRPSRGGCTKLPPKKGKWARQLVGEGNQRGGLGFYSMAIGSKRGVYGSESSEGQSGLRTLRDTGFVLSKTSRGQVHLPGGTCKAGSKSLKVYLLGYIQSNCEIGI